MIKKCECLDRELVKILVPAVRSAIQIRKTNVGRRTSYLHRRGDEPRPLADHWTEHEWQEFLRGKAISINPHYYEEPDEKAAWFMAGTGKSADVIQEELNKKYPHGYKVSDWRNAQKTILPLSENEVAEYKKEVIGDRRDRFQPQMIRHQDLSRDLERAEKELAAANNLLDDIMDSKECQSKEKVKDVIDEILTVSIVEQLSPELY